MDEKPVTASRRHKDQLAHVKRLMLDSTLDPNEPPLRDEILKLVAIGNEMVAEMNVDSERRNELLRELEWQDFRAWCDSKATP